MERKVINWIKRATFLGAYIWRADVSDFVERTWPTKTPHLQRRLALRAIANAPDELKWALT